MASTEFPALVSAPRITTLLTSLFVALGSGTNYVYSAYAPQLGARLHITHTQLNVVGLAGNVGVYLSGPIWGRIVDTRGPRILLVGAFICLLTGYSGIRYLFNAGVASPDSPLSPLHFGMLVVCSLMTGAGGSGGLAASMNSTAKSFPDKARATTTGFVLSGFGLSAFLFSAIAHTMFAGDTSSMLLLLALGTSFPMIIGFFYVRPIPLPPFESARATEASFRDSAVVDASAVFQQDNNSETPLLGEDRDEDGQTLEYVVPEYRNSVELSPPLSVESGHRRSRSRRERNRSLGARASTLLDGQPNIHGKALWKSPDFLLLFLILSLLSGTGLMYINNVGSMSQALYAKANPKYDEEVASRWQAMQVSSISVTNFLGRILIGLAADVAKNHLHVPRSYCLTLVSSFFLASQIFAASIQNVQNLWRASTLLGLAYGGVFGLFPTICIEWFGLSHFSENWGFLSMSPMGGGYLFSLAFGRNLDAHAPHESGTPAPRGTSSAHQCLEGRACYVDSLRLTTIACAVAVVLSVWAGWRDRRKTV